MQVFSYDHYGRDRGGELGHPVSSAGGVPSLLGNVGLEEPLEAHPTHHLLGQLNGAAHPYRLTNIGQCLHGKSLHLSQGFFDSAYCFCT